MNDYFVRVYPPPDDVLARDVDDEPIPLVDDAYVPPESEPEPDAPRTHRLHPCVVLAPLWYIAFASFLAAAIIVLIMYPLEPAEYVNDQRAILIGQTIGFLFWGITIGLRRCARRNKDATS